jgi:hypothetical protein
MFFKLSPSDCDFDKYYYDALMLHICGFGKYFSRVNTIKEKNNFHDGKVCPARDWLTYKALNST